MKIIYFLVCCILFPYSLFAQKEQNELLNTLDHAANDSEKIVAYHRLIRHFSHIAPDSAIYYAGQAIQYSNSKKDSLNPANERRHDKSLILIYKQLAEIYKRQSKYKEALSAVEQAQNLTDSVYHVNTVKEIASLGSASGIETEQRINQLELINSKNADQRNIIIAVAAAFLLMLLVLLLFYAKTMKMNRKMAKHEIDSKN